MRVSSDKQTLILKGESFPPPRLSAGAGASRSDTGVQLQRVTMLLLRGDHAAPALAAESNAMVPPAVTRPVLLTAVDALSAADQSVVPYSSSSGRSLSGGAAEYARTQNLSGTRSRSQLIDTYA